MRRIVVFDFDKTIISENSFPAWVYFLLKKSVASFGVAILVKLISLLFMRKVAKKIDHVALKESILLEKIPESWHEEFARILIKKIRPTVFEKLNSHIDRGDVVVVSSAAPTLYLNEFISMALRDKSSRVVVIGSEVKGGVLFDNYKEKKVLSFRSAFHGGGIFVDVLYTDSWDDRHLAEISRSVVLVNPSVVDVRRFKECAHLSSRISVFGG